MLLSTYFSFQFAKNLKTTGQPKIKPTYKKSLEPALVIRLDTIVVGLRRTCDQLLRCTKKKNTYV